MKTWGVLTMLIAVCIACSGVISGTSSSLLLRTWPFLVWTAASPLVVFVTRRTSNIAVHAATLLAISFASMLPAFLRSGPAALASDLGRGKLILDLLIYAAIVATASTTAALDRVRAAENARRSIEREVGDARLHIERSRIPHSFLQSMFDSIERWIAIDAIRAETIGLRSAVFLRGVIDALSARVWSVSREFELVESYFDLDAARGGNGRLRVDVAQPIRAQHVAAGSLQSPLFASEIESAEIRGETGGVSLRINSSTTLHVPFEGDAIAANETVAPVRRFSPAIAGVAIISLVLIVSVAVQAAERSGFQRWYLPWATLRFALAAILPLALARWLPRNVFAFIAVSSALIGEISFFSIVATLHPSAVPPLFSRASLALALESIALGSVLNLALLLLLERLRVLRDELRDDDRRRELQQQLSHAHLELLRSQIRPHFLFNALNSLLALIASDSAAALQMLARLRSFYSKAATADRDETMTVADEVALASEYLDIERVRFGARLATTIVIEPEALPSRVPSLLLQPLVENAIKHGIAKHAGAGWVDIRIRREQRRIEIEIRNSGPAKETEHARTGVGLANTTRRLEAMYGRDASLDSTIEPGGVNMLRILLPAS